MCLFRPMLLLSAAVPQRNYVGVLIDDSRSMRIADRDGKPRSDWVEHAFGGPDSALLKALRQKFIVRLFRFSSSAQRIDSVSDLKFGAGETHLGAAIEQGRIQRQVQDAAYAAQQAIDRGESVIVGVNQFTTDEPAAIELLRIDPESERRQAEAVRSLRHRRDNAACKSALDAIVTAARGSANLVPPIIAAVEARATLGEIADAMRGVFGEHREIHT